MEALSVKEMSKKYYECIVCGRKFPEGQGIIIEKAGVRLYFHSNRCASKFLRLLLERVDDSCVRPVLKELVDELARSLELKRKKTRKVI